MYCFRRLVTLSIDGDPSCYLYFDFIFAPVYGCARSRWIIGRCSPEGSIVLLEETCRRQPARGGRAEAAERISPDRRRRRVSVPALRADRSIGPAREGRPRAPPPPSINSLVLFTMLIGAHVKHKFMLKAEMRIGLAGLRGARKLHGADRSLLPLSPIRGPLLYRLVRRCSPEWS